MIHSLWNKDNFSEVWKGLRIQRDQHNLVQHVFLEKLLKCTDAIQQEINYWYICIIKIKQLSTELKQTLNVGVSALSCTYLIITFGKNIPGWWFRRYTILSTLKELSVALDSNHCKRCYQLRCWTALEIKILRWRKLFIKHEGRKTLMFEHKYSDHVYTETLAPMFE